MKRSARKPPGLDTSSPELAKFAAMLGTMALETSLLEASRHSVRRALAALGDWPEVGFQSGQALEHLAKAVIFRVDPRELTQANRRESAAFLAGEGHSEIWFLADVYTIQGPKSVERAAQLIEIEPPDPTKIDQVFIARNAAAHLWHGDADLAFGSLSSLVVLARPLLGWLGLSHGEWIDDPDLTVVANELLGSETGPRARLRATAFSRIHGARQEWRSIARRIPSEVLADLGVSKSEPPDLESPVLRSCPVGGHLAWFELEWREAEIQDDIPEDEREDEAYLSSLECPLCGLELDGDHFWALGDEVIDRRWVDR